MGNYKNVGNYKPAPGNTFVRVVRTADTTITTDTTLGDDLQLKATLDISKHYHFELKLWHQSHTTPDFKFDFTLPSGATGDYAVTAYDPLISSNTVAHNITSVIATTTSNVTQYSVITGRIIMSTTAGQIVFRWAQNTSSGSDTIVLKGSTLIIWKET